ncbi:MAG: hypothetical protein JXA94_05040 [Parachlamydiales bacterium]|nr:hypothetical protein [Parachlamydiales bacterium]
MNELAYKYFEIEKNIKLNLLDFDEKYERAKFFYESGYYLQAKDIFIQLALKRPLDKDYWYCLASSFFQLKNYEQSKKAFEMTIFLDSENALAHLFLAECLISLNEKEKAFEILEKAESKIFDEILLNKIKILKNQNF